MSLRFTNFAILLLSLFFFEFNATTLLEGNNHEDPTTKTMEDFSGYPIHESHSFISNALSSLSVDAQTLQNQVIKTQFFFIFFFHFQYYQVSSFFIGLMSFVSYFDIFCQIDELSRLSDTPAPSVTRILYTDKDVLARRFVVKSLLSSLLLKKKQNNNFFFFLSFSGL